MSEGDVDDVALLYIDRPLTSVATVALRSSSDVDGATFSAELSPRSTARFAFSKPATWCSIDTYFIALELDRTSFFDR